MRVSARRPHAQAGEARAVLVFALRRCAPCQYGQILAAATGAKGPHPLVRLARANGQSPGCACLCGAFSPKRDRAGLVQRFPKWQTRAVPCPGRPALLRTPCPSAINMPLTHTPCTPLAVSANASRRRANRGAAARRYDRRGRIEQQQIGVRSLAQYAAIPDAEQFALVHW